MIVDHLAEAVRTAVARAGSDGVFELDEVPEPFFERPRNREHGDWASNIALVLAKGRGAPRPIAEAIAARIPKSDLISGVDVAGPGFLNFRLAPRWLHDVVQRAADAGSTFGRTAAGAGERINVEFVSANPTGPINVVSGRHAAVGDALAATLAAAGHDVTREFYVNDVGRQIRLFGETIAARYLQRHGRDAAIPEDGYQGDYVIDLAREIAEQAGDAHLESDPEARAELFARLGVARMIDRMKSSLANFGTTYDVWFSQASLIDSGAVDAVLEELTQKGLIQERDGARWFLASTLGDEKDRVVVRANGEPTYFASDLAYLRNKFERGFDRLIYLWGADHHGTVPRLMAAVEALGYDRKKVEVPLVQIVTLVSGGETVKASKRAGVIVELDDLVAEVGRDAVRYMFLTRGYETPLDFDIELAKEQAPENPVYYVQYAHARICSIIRKARTEGHAGGEKITDLTRLSHPSESELMRKLASYEELIPDSAALRAPQKLPRYLEELASTFSAFYRDCRVVSEDGELTRARLVLCRATQRVLADGLGLLGVAAPEQM